jgi:hypothetical protein
MGIATPDVLMPTRVRSGGGFTSIAPPGGQSNLYQLMQGHFTPAKRPPSLVYPRPDAETHVDSKHRRHYPGLKYEIPVGVDFGAWPYYYELTDAPAGMAIGQTLWLPNYGVVSWDNPVAGTYTVAGRVTDQDGNVVTFQWSVTITTAKAIFIDAVNGNNSNNGSINAPFLNNQGWHLGTIATTTYAGYHVYYRGGNHQLAGMASNSNNIRIDGFSQHPAAFVRYPGETVNIDCSTGRFFSMSPHSDLFVSGIRFHDGRQDFENAHFFWLAAGGISRCTFFRNVFDTLGPGTVGTDNTSCVFISDTSGRKSHMYFCENEYTGLGSSSNGVSAFDAYYTDHILFERNDLHDLTSAYCIWPKIQNDFVCIRNNKARNFTSGWAMAVVGFDNANHVAEVCFNTFLNDNASAPTIMFDMGVGGMGQAYAYRNTVIGEIHGRTPASSGIVRDANNNIVICPTADWLIRMTDVGASNVHYASASGVLDVNGLLTGAARDNYLGTHGAEVPLTSLAA